MNRRDMNKIKTLPITRTIWVSCLSHFLLLLLHSRQICNGRCTWIPAFAKATAVKARICPRLKSSALTNFWHRDSLCRDTAPVLFIKQQYRDRFPSTYKVCTATHVMLNKICTMTAKSAPYPPCTVIALWLKYQDPARCLRRVTQPPHIAGPLGASGHSVNH